LKILVAYFSAEGTTAKVAKAFAEAIGADLFEIVPEQPYTAADIRWTNPLARCNREKIGKKDVPVAEKVPGFEQYDRIFLGFPIWYGCAPNVVNTFCKDYDWSGRRVYAFATSGGSGIGKTAEKLKPYVNGAAEVDAKLVRSASELEVWAKSL
jgi:flavodoxin